MTVSARFKPKWLFLIAMLLSALAFSAGVISHRTSLNVQSSDEVPASLAKYYESLEEMVADSSIVAEVKVLTDPKSFEYNTVLYSTNEVEVIRELKGPGNRSKITIIDNGGIYKGKEVALGGMPLLHKGEHYLLFLKKYSGSATTGEV